MPIVLKAQDLSGGKHCYRDVSCDIPNSMVTQGYSKIH